MHVLPHPLVRPRRPARGGAHRGADPHPPRDAAAAPGAGRRGRLGGRDRRGEGRRRSRACRRVRRSLPPRTGPAKPAERPAVTQPAPLAAEPLPPRPSPRLDLGAEPAAVPVSAAAPEPRSRFGAGLLLALVLFGLALAAYAYRPEIAARVPAAAPALDAYGEAVDGLREDLEAGFDELRAYLDGV